MRTKKVVHAHNVLVQPPTTDQTTMRASAPAVHVLLDSTTSGGRVALIETVAVPGMEPPCHRHLEADTLLDVVAGEIDLYLDGDWNRAPAGSVRWIPSDTAHTFAVVGPQAYLLTVFLPAGFEQFYTELGPAPWHDVERAIGTAARYGCEITGPHPGPQPDAFPG